MRLFETFRTFLIYFHRRIIKASRVYWCVTLSLVLSLQRLNDSYLLVCDQCLQRSTDIMTSLYNDVTKDRQGSKVFPTKLRCRSITNNVHMGTQNYTMSPRRQQKKRNLGSRHEHPYTLLLFAVLWNCSILITRTSLIIVKDILL